MNLFERAQEVEEVKGANPKIKIEGKWLVHLLKSVMPSISEKLNTLFFAAVLPVFHFQQPSFYGVTLSVKLVHQHFFETILKTVFERVV